MKRFSVAVLGMLLAVLSVMPATADDYSYMKQSKEENIAWLNANIQPTVLTGGIKGTIGYFFTEEGVTWPMGTTNKYVPWAKVTSFGTTDLGRLYVSYKNLSNDNTYLYITPKPGVSAKDIGNRMGWLVIKDGGNYNWWGGTLTDSDTAYHQRNTPPERTQAQDDAEDFAVGFLTILYVVVMLALL